MIRNEAALLLCLLPAVSCGLLSIAEAQENIRTTIIPGPVAAELIRVIDGDTLLVSARPWPQQSVEVYVRLRGIDAPELHSRCAGTRAAGVRAKEALEQLTTEGKLSLEHISGDKYFGRVVADVISGDGRDAAADLLSEGYVVQYDGGRKRSSCE